MDLCTLLPEVPKQFVVNTGEEEIGAIETEKFFDGVLAYLGYPSTAVGIFTEVLIVLLSRPEWQPDNGVAREDYIKILIVKDVMIASVIARRTDFNYVEFSFALYPLPEETIELVKWREPN